jgi:hypothetical protein
MRRLTLSSTELGIGYRLKARCLSGFGSIPRANMGMAPSSLWALHILARRLFKLFPGLPLQSLSQAPPGDLRGDAQCWPCSHPAVNLDLGSRERRIASSSFIHRNGDSVPTNQDSFGTSIDDIGLESSFPIRLFHSDS